MDDRKSFDPPIPRTANLCETQSIKHMFCSVTNIEQKSFQSNFDRAPTKSKLSLLIKNRAITYIILKLECSHKLFKYLNFLNYIIRN